jgi:DNA invertase Pin-like site-specific DNA recombinase
VRKRPTTRGASGGGLREDLRGEVSSTKERRPVLQEALDYLRAGDVLVVWRLDRLGRSLKELIDVVGDLEGRGVEFESLR